MIEDIKNHSLEDIRQAYREYLEQQNLSRNTIVTSSTDAFYIWRNANAETFWSVILSDDYESFARKTLLELLQTRSKGNVEKSINGYLTHLRKFMSFLQSEENPEIPKVVPKTKVRVTANISHGRVSQVLPNPSVEQVEYYLAQWNALEDYHLQEDALDRLFFTLSPENNNISDILLKVSVLNDFYSTNIYKVYLVAKHILSLHIDERLQASDVSLVDDIKKVNVGKKAINYYSFATKYCSHHKPIEYPIYDSYVDEVLRYFRNRDGFSSFKNNELKVYARFKTILEEFRSFYNLDNYNLKELDKYLWQLGKEYFNKYSKNINGDI